MFKRKIIQKISGFSSALKNQTAAEEIQPESDIIGDGYVLPTPSPRIKPYARIIAVMMLVFAAAYDVYIAAAAFLTANQGSQISFDFALIMLTIIANLLVPAAIVVLIVDGKTRKKIIRAWRQSQSSQKENETVLLTRLSIEKLFEAEFTEAEELNPELAEIGGQEDITAYIDNDITLISAAETLIDFMKERGLILTPASARETLSAMFASRLLVLNGCDTETGRVFIQNLSQYFGTLPFMYQANETDENDVFAATDQAVSTAAANRHLIHIACFEDVDFKKTGDPSFAQISGYAASFGSDYRVLLKGKNEWTTVPLNLWFAIIPQGGALDNLPQGIAESAVIIDVKPRKIDPKKEITKIPPFNRYQLLKLGSDSEKAHFLGEAMFRRLDKVESAVNTHVPYRISNKGWRRIEKYSAAYLACGGCHDEAFDSVLKAKLIPEITPIVGNSEFNLESILN